MFKPTQSYLITACLALMLAPLSNETKAVSQNQAWIRLNEPAHFIKVDPKKGRYVAFSGQGSNGLFVLDLKTKLTTTISSKPVQGSFVWSPDGIRIIYRDQVSTGKDIEGRMMAYDLIQSKNHVLDELSSQSGFITFDPRDYKLLLMHDQGVLRKSLKLPNSRLAKWQLKSKSKDGFWIANPGGIVFISASGRKMTTLQDDGSGIESFDIAKDGTKIVWATKNSKMYWAKDGNKAQFIDNGKDPKWDAASTRIVYSGARLIGKKTSGYDLKITDLSGNEKWLTQTFQSDERWPDILPNGSIIYTKDKSTDLYALKLSE